MRKSFIFYVLFFTFLCININAFNLKTGYVNIGNGYLYYEKVLL